MTRPIPMPLDPVTGSESRGLYRDCHAERKRAWFRDTCGPEGKYWEAK